MTCTHAALKRHDLVELGFKVTVKSMVMLVFTAIVPLSTYFEMINLFISMTTS